MKKKILFITALFGLTILTICHLRVPFFKQDGGPWSVGFSFSNNFPEQIVVKKNPIFRLEDLKKYDDSTRFLADPFFLKVKDTFYLFVEHQKLKGGASIALLTSTDGLHYTPKGTVLKEKFHLSYPQVFTYKNEFYMLPESQQSHQVLLYKAKKFPYQWAICDTLIKNIQLKDPSIYLSDTLNILLACDKKQTLHMYQADSLFGNWKLHAQPNVLTGSESRPGGRITAYKNRLILPIQNAANGYGYGLSLYEMKFVKGRYTIQKIKPFFLHKQDDIPEFNAGMHQFDIQKIDNKYYYVYDGNRLKSNKKIFNLKVSLITNLRDFKNWLKLTFN
jgi:hypothetical protein